MNTAAQAIFSDIIRASRNNRAITSSGLIDEMERGAIDGWRHLDSVRWSNFANWTRAMCEAAAELKRLEDQKARAQARRLAA